MDMVVGRGRGSPRRTISKAFVDPALELGNIVWFPLRLVGCCECIGAIVDSDGRKQELVNGPEPSVILPQTIMYSTKVTKPFSFVFSQKT